MNKQADSIDSLIATRRTDNDGHLPIDGLTVALLTEWIRTYLDDHRAVVGLSGGIDSSVVAKLCVMAVPDKVDLYYLPITHRDDQPFVEDLLRSLDNYHYTETDLTKVFDAFCVVLNAPTHRMADANLKSRMRMCTLYYYANFNDGMVVGTGNRSEDLIGYFTKYGDGGVDLLPLGAFLKTEVIELAKYIGIPQSIVERPPTAALWPGQTDENEIGMSYTDIDKILDKCIRLEDDFMMLTKFEDDIEEKVRKVGAMVEGSRHKRRYPPIPGGGY